MFSMTAYEQIVDINGKCVICRILQISGSFTVAKLAIWLFNVTLVDFKEMNE